MRKNKWSLYDNSETIEYSFPAQNIAFLDLIDKVISIFEESELLKLSMTEDDHLDFSTKKSKVISALSNLKAINGKGLYPRISSTEIYNYGNETYHDIEFTCPLFVYDSFSEVVQKAFGLNSLNQYLTDINHSQAKSTGFLPPLEFETYFGIGPNREIFSYDLLIHINTDIWLKKVPCPHCDKPISNEELRKKGGLNAINIYWHDNEELSNLNKGKMDRFLSRMNQLTNEIDGKQSVENLRLYEGKIGLDKLSLS